MQRVRERAVQTVQTGQQVQSQTLQTLQTLRKGRATNHVRKLRAAEMNPFAVGLCRGGKECGEGFIADTVGRGFTLTEVLIVAVIIGILLALVSAAVFPALDSAKEFARYREAANLSMAMESFKSQYGATPPADLTQTGASGAVTKFFARAFPRYTPTNLANELQTAGASDTYDPGNALVFWLVGFSGDPTNPLSGHAVRMQNGGGNGEPFYEFDTERLSGTGGTGTVRYYPNLPGGQETYDGDTDGTKAFLYFAKPYAASSTPAFTPYQKKGTTNYYNPRSFQIIQAGLDNSLGDGGVLNDANSLEDDNIASFASGTIRDFYEQNNN